jgi:tetratricopeptide (TPR) repeat protein
MTREELIAKHDAAALAGAEAMARGRFGLALDLFEESLEHAEELDERRKVHAARLNVSSCYLSLGDWSRAKAGLPAIILETELPRHAATAAIRLAEALIKEGSHEKAAHYLRTGLQHARAAQDRSREMTALALQGLLDVMEGRHSQAVERYAAALAIAEETGAPHRTSLLDQLGYARIVAGEVLHGVRTLHQGLRAARQDENVWMEAEVHVDLAFGFLLAEKNGAAERHALKALALVARASDHPAVHKNAAFILMELALRGARPADFERWFQRLQELLPDVKLSRDFFRIFDISDVVNLKEF